MQEWFKSLGETTAEDSEDIHKMEKALKRVRDLPLSLIVNRITFKNKTNHSNSYNVGV